MSDEVKKVLDRVAGNYNKMAAAMVSARGSLMSVELRASVVGDEDEDHFAAGTAAIARSAIRSIDDCLSSMEEL